MGPALLRAAAAAEALVEAHDTRDPFHLAKALGIALYRPNTFQELKGMYAVIEGRPCIFLKGELSASMAQVVMAHELGHHCLHREIAESNQLIHDSHFLQLRSRPEREANAFAAALLIPDDILLSLAEEGLTQAQIAASLGYPEPLLLFKVAQLQAKGLRLGTAVLVSADFLQSS